MRKPFFAIMLAVSLFVGAGQSLAASSYPDVPTNHWARTYIENLANKRVLTGYPNGKFEPDGLVTRAEFAKIVVLASGVSNTASSTASSFSDVPNGSWATQYIEVARAAGIIDGYKDGFFKPINFVTRAEIAKMVIVARKSKKGSSIRQAAAATFPDIDTNWAREYIIEAKDLGFIGGYADGTFGPGKNVTRAEVSKIVSLAFADILGAQTTNPQIPVITISTPTPADNYTTASDRITIGGAASDDVAVTEISWVNNVGSKGTIAAGESWTIKDIALKQGLNIITVSATDASGNVGTDMIRVTCNSQGGSGGGGGSSADSPSLQIQRGDIYWDNETNRILAVPFTIKNNGPGSALSPKIEEATADSGVTVDSIEQPTGTIAPNSTKTIAIKYKVPVGVTTFKFKLSFSCQDVSGDIYKY